MAASTVSPVWSTRPPAQGSRRWTRSSEGKKAANKSGRGEHGGHGNHIGARRAEEERLKARYSAQVPYLDNACLTSKGVCERVADIVNVRTSAQGREYVDLMNEHLRCRALPVVPDLEQAEQGRAGGRLDCGCATKTGFWRSQLSKPNFGWFVGYTAVASSAAPSRMVQAPFLIRRHGLTTPIPFNRLRPDLFTSLPQNGSRVNSVPLKPQ